MSEQKAILVTDASSGNGQAIAQVLAPKGFTVFGTSRSPSGVEQTPGVDVVPLDVRPDESGNACVEAISKRAERLDILINNAGHELGGETEEIAMEESRSRFETNFFGVMRMVKAALPIMRRQNSGQIINISPLSAEL